MAWHLERSSLSVGVPRKESESGHPGQGWPAFLEVFQWLFVPDPPPRQPLSLGSVQAQHCLPGPLCPSQNAQPAKEAEQQKPSQTTSLKAAPTGWQVPPQKGRPRAQVCVSSERGWGGPAPFKCFLVRRHYPVNVFLTHLFPERPEEKLFQGVEEGGPEDCWEAGGSPRPGPSSFCSRICGPSGGYSAFIPQIPSARPLTDLCGADARGSEEDTMPLFVGGIWAGSQERKLDSAPDSRLCLGCL